MKLKTKTIIALSEREATIIATKLLGAGPAGKVTEAEKAEEQEVIQRFLKLMGFRP